MSNPKAREEEYLRRMKERGYIPSLAGMDDDDIEWALEKMDRGRIEPEPEYQFNKTYRPPDRDFAERMFKMFARPFDPNWKMPDLDGPEFRQPPKPEPQGGARRPDWGGGENLLRQDGSQTMMYWPGRDNTFLPSRGTVERTLRNWPGGDNGAQVQAMSYNASMDGRGNDGSGVMQAKGKYDIPIQIGGEVLKEYISAAEFAAEVEKEALAQGDSPELAKKKGQDAYGLYGIYSVGTGSGSILAGKKNVVVGTGAAVAGSVIGSQVLKPWIKKHVLGKTEEDYNKPLFPGATPPGPG